MTREEQIIEAAEKATYQEPPQYSELVHKARKVMSAYEIGFIDGCVWADQHPHWIPVEDYPKVDISCTLLVHYVDGTIDICDYYGDYYDYTGENVTRNVTHWMPMPQPTRKEE